MTMFDITENDRRLIARIRACRLADLADGMDAIGLVNRGSMSKMRPLRPGIKTAGFAYTAKLIPCQKDVKVCDTFDEYMDELAAWCKDTYTFFDPIEFDEVPGEDLVVVVDMGSTECGLWGSEIGMKAMTKGVVGVVLDGACRDSYEANLEQVVVWCTQRTFNHVYGRLENGGVNVPIQCAGVMVRPKDIICGDDDGVLVIPYEKAEKVLYFAEMIQEDDRLKRAKHYKSLGYEYDETLGNVRVD